VRGKRRVGKTSNASSPFPASSPPSEVTNPRNKRFLGIIEIGSQHFSGEAFFFPSLEVLSQSNVEKPRRKPTDASSDFPSLSPLLPPEQ